MFVSTFEKFIFIFPKFWNKNWAKQSIYHSKILTWWLFVFLDFSFAFGVTVETSWFCRQKWLRRGKIWLNQMPDLHVQPWDVFGHSPQLWLLWVIYNGSSTYTNDVMWFPLKPGWGGWCIPEHPRQCWTWLIARGLGHHSQAGVLGLLRCDTKLL